MPTVVVFDVNETLLDLASLDSFFERTLGEAAARREWFGELLHAALVTTATGDYHTFGAIGLAALRVLGARRGRVVGDAEERGLVDAMTHMSVHPEVPRALERLRDAGFRMAALTNSTLEVAMAAFTHTGVGGWFEEVLSADEVRRLKPAPEPYRHAADRMGVGVGDLLMVAAHGWDVAGAQAAGARAAFVARPGQTLLPTAPVPAIVGGDLREVAEEIVSTETP